MQTRSGGGFLRRTIRALSLDSDLYREVSAPGASTRQAVLIVMLAAVGAGLSESGRTLLSMLRVAFHLNVEPSSSCGTRLWTKRCQSPRYTPPCPPGSLARVGRGAVDHWRASGVSRRSDATVRVSRAQPCVCAGAGPVSHSHAGFRSRLRTNHRPGHRSCDRYRTLGFCGLATSAVTRLRLPVVNRRVGADRGPILPFASRWA